MTYKAARFERTWLSSSLRDFYRQELITDVLSSVRGGKEASVYCCVPGPGIDAPYVAAKVYRPRRFRNLRNDSLYRAGRPILTSGGVAVKKSDHRIMRAVGKKTAFGVQVSHTSWLMYEYTSLARLHAAGAAVPKPYSASENAILMDYIGDNDGPAPALSQIHLEGAEAAALFAEAVRNIELMLQHGIIHGDLSAYNLLYRKGAITVIDFPQMTLLTGNPNAAFILERDILRVCEYFADHGVACDPEAIFADLWERYREE